MFVFLLLLIWSMFCQSKTAIKRNIPQVNRSWLTFKFKTIKSIFMNVHMTCCRCCSFKCDSYHIYYPTKPNECKMMPA